MMNLNDFRKFVGKNGTFTYHGELIRIRIDDVERVGGNLWISYAFMSHQHLSPMIYGCHLNRANCCLDDTYRGWFSEEIRNSFRPLCNPQGQ